MSNAAPIAILGFTTFERSTFEAFFRLASRRTPAYRLEAEVSAAEFVIADGDDPVIAAGVRAKGLLPRCVMLGAVEHPEAVLQLSRPINLMLLVRALDALPRVATVAAAAAPAQAEPSVPTRAEVPPAVPPAVSLAVPHAARPAASMSAGASIRIPMPAPSTMALAAPPTPAVPPAARPALLGELRVTPLSPPPAAPSALPPRGTDPLGAARSKPSEEDDAQSPGLDHILVVDDSDIALRFMASNLSRFGFQVHLARSGEEAIERVSKRHFEMVFLDVMMEGMDGFKTCKAIKRSAYADHRPPPTVVMLTSRGTAVDKMRGTMAGCDAYLTKPLREAELMALVGDREVKRHAYASTFHASVTML